MTYNIALTKRVTNGYLVDELRMAPNYWGFFQLTDEQFNAILKKVVQLDKITHFR
jgi:hypothetical protein